MYETMKTDLWQGRVDDHESKGTLRWHQQVRPIELEDQPGIALLGICCDTGVVRNQGRSGAQRGPNEIRKAMANQAWHLDRPLYDAGNLHCDDNNLSQLSEDQADQVQQLLQRNHFPLLIGGGHEIAYGSFLGLSRFLATRRSGPIGILNFDAHFDLRQDKQASSGTPFRQIAELCARNEQPFHYCCLGVSETSNTQALFQRAEQLGVSYLRDDQLSELQLPAARALLDSFIAPLSALYISIDLDVLPAAVAPGVSAPAAGGVPLMIVEALIDHARKQAGDRLRLADIAEYNPNHDRDSQTAKVAARIAHRLLRPLRESPL